MNMTCTKYYRMMEKSRRPHNSKPGGIPEDNVSHTRHLSVDYRLAAVIVAVLVVAFLVQGGLPPSDSQELAWLNRLAAADNPDAQLQLGLAYREGRYGLAPDARAGQYWLEKAARNGEDYAINLLAGHSTTEAGRDETARTSVTSRLDTIATQVKSPMLMTISSLWKILGLGLIGSQSSDALQQRAQSGDPAAEFQLGMRYRDGAWSVNRDPDKASYWLKRAADAGNPLAEKVLAGKDNTTN
jgi:uncharacterized protein